MRVTGHYETLGNINYFIPDALPPKNPPFVMNAEIATLYGEVMLQLGKLNEMTHRLPDMHRFIKAYVMKEAVLTSAIEGIHTTLIDIFTQPLITTNISKDTQLVLNYTKSLFVALAMLKQGLPISSRIILAAHEALMQLGEGDHANPGHYRKQAVRVGNLIPPPPQQVSSLMADLEQYINAEQILPPLINAGLMHVQFETIHPFLDGNGRIGRLLIVLMLIENGLLAEPILYPSYYFKKNQFEYYQRLDRVRTHGDFEGWIIYYLTALRDSALDTYRRAIDIENLEKNLKNQIMGEKNLRQNTKELQMHTLEILFKYPAITSNILQEQLKISGLRTRQIISYFVEQEILIQEVEQKQNKLFKFKPYLELLEREYK